MGCMNFELSKLPVDQVLNRGKSSSSRAFSSLGFIKFPQILPEDNIRGHEQLGG